MEQLVWQRAQGRANTASFPGSTPAFRLKLITSSRASTVDRRSPRTSPEAASIATLSRDQICRESTTRPARSFGSTTRAGTSGRRTLRGTALSSSARRRSGGPQSPSCRLTTLTPSLPARRSSWKGPSRRRARRRGAAIASSSCAARSGPGARGKPGVRHRFRWERSRGSGTVFRWKNGA